MDYQISPLHRLSEVVTIPAGTALIVDGKSRTTAETFTIARNAIGSTVIKIGAATIYADGNDAHHIHQRLVALAQP